MARKKTQFQSAETTIESFNYDGRGVTHVDGQVVFVDGALPGETVEIEYKKVRKNVYEGRVQRVLQAAADRTEPECQYFGVCGGCSLQHLSSAAQIQAKQGILQDHFGRIGKVAAARTLPALVDEPWGYRRKARLGVRYVPKKGGVLVGFRERRSNYVTNLDACLTLHPDLSSRLPALRQCIEQLSIKDRIPQVEVAAAENAIVFVFRHLEDFTDEDLRCLRQFGDREAVQVFLQGGGIDSIYCLTPDNPQPLHFSLPAYQLRYTFLPTDFTQVNFGMNQKMVQQALELLHPQPGDRVLELFCGLGNFSLPVAQQVEAVLAIEGDESLVDRARHNAKENNVANVEFRAGDLYADPGPEMWQGFEFNKVLLDPPRSGALEAVTLIAEQRPETIVYVSCNPATLARDSEYLVNEKGYYLECAGVMDMFPHTSHVESIALFTLEAP